MFKFGLKLWSTNLNYIQEAQRLYDEKYCDYIELFAVPGTYLEVIKKWKSLNVPYVIHAPHYHKGLNFSKREDLEKNLLLAEETFKFADDLGAKIIIFHPGVGGNIEETAYQLNRIKDSRVVIENKPYFAIGSDLICNGNSPEDIEFIIEQTGVGFCFDIGHAIYSANAKSINLFTCLSAFKKLKPRIFHFCDGDINGVYDEHLHFGHGSYDIERILGLFPDDSLISIETEKSFKDSLRDFKADIDFFKKLIGK